MTLPVSAGTANYILTTNGSGVSAWSPITTSAWLATSTTAGTIDPYSTNGIVYSGVWTPTFSLVNASSGTARAFNYTRIGAVVFCSGVIDGLTVTTTLTDTTVTLTSLPVATANFTTVYQASGVGGLFRNVNDIKDHGQVNAVSGAQTVILKVDSTNCATGGTAVAVHFAFSYQIQ